MGICGSTMTDEERQALEASKKLDAELHEAADEDSSRVKLLLQGERQAVCLYTQWKEEGKKKEKNGLE